jgi:hypothetical protein
MNANELVVGDVVYKCGVDDQNGLKSVIVVSSWLYLGKFKSNHSCGECDVPFEYFKFAEHESIHHQENDSDAKTHAILIPSVSQVELVMLSAEELLDELGFWIKELGKEKSSGTNGSIQ